MERDMGTTIATESDLQFLRQELAAGMSLLATKEELQAARADITALRQDNALFRKDMQLQSSRIDAATHQVSHQQTPIHGFQQVGIHQPPFLRFDTLVVEGGTGERFLEVGLVAQGAQRSLWMCSALAHSSLKS